MLDEDKYIDQLFKEKLGEYEKNPPLSLWEDIQAKLNVRRHERRIIVFKMIGMAAAIVVALLAGLQITNHLVKNTDIQTITILKPDTNRKVDKSSLKITENTISQDLTSKQNISYNVKPSRKQHLPLASNISSLAAFAAPTSFINSNIHSAVKKPGDLELVSSEKEILDELQHKFNVVKKLTDWFSAKNQDSSVVKKPNTKTIIIDPFRSASTEGTELLALTDRSGKSAGRWNLKAEFASLYNNQAEVKGQNNNFQLNSTPTYKPQKTKPENTLSAGMIIGYKVSKRLVVKSGIVYNSIRQTTSDVEFLGVNQYFTMALYSSTASTPTGMVNLNKTSNTGTEAMFNSGNQFDNSSKYSHNYSGENKLSQNLEYIEIPIQATYKLLDKKIAIGVTGEIGTNFLVGNKAILSGNGSNISSGETTNMRNVVYSGSLGVELGYEITKRITVTVEPRIKQFINSLSTSKSVNYKPSQLGVVTGLTYSFN